MAQDLLDRFFRDAEGKTNRQIDVYFALEDMGIARDKADEGLEYLTSRGLINMFGPDVAYLTAEGASAIAEEENIGKLPKLVRAFGAQPAAGAAPVPEAPAAPAPQETAAEPGGQTGAAEVPRTATPTLSFADAEGIDHAFVLGWRSTVGRTEGNTIQIHDQRASKTHVEIKFERGGYLLRDLGAANGTIVNGEYIDQHQLQHGDRILVGRTTLLFQCPELIEPPPGPEPQLEAPTQPPRSAWAPTERPHPSASSDVPPPPDTLRGAQPIRVVKGRPDSRRDAQPAASESIDDLFATAKPSSAGVEPAAAVFPAPLAQPGDPNDLFAHPAIAGRPLPGTGEEPFDADTVRRSRGPESFAAEHARGPEASEDLFATIVQSPHRAPEAPFAETHGSERGRHATPIRDTESLDLHGGAERAPEAIEPIDLVEQVSDDAQSTRRYPPAFDTQPPFGKRDDAWSKDRTPQERLLGSQPEPARPLSGAATTHDAAEADTHLQLSQEPGYPDPAEEPRLHDTMPPGMAPGHLSRWGDEGASHPRFAPADSSAPKALRGEDLPEAPLSLEDVGRSVPSRPAAHPGGDSDFHSTLRELRARVEEDDPPDRAALLQALDLLERHPYVRIALGMNHLGR